MGKVQVNSQVTQSQQSQEQRVPAGVEPATGARKEPQVCRRSGEEAQVTWTTRERACQELDLCALVCVVDFKEDLGGGG